MKPIRLELENFITHTHSILDFTTFDVALLIGSYNGNPQISNGTGKTSLFGALRWVLTNKSKFSSKVDMIKHGKSYCRVSFQFSVDNIEYKIVRRIVKKTGITDVVFYQKVGEIWESEGLTCDTATMTNRKIAEIIKMSDEIFVNSVYFQQNDIAGFAASSTAKRREILRDILQIGIWDEYQETAKKIQKDLQSQAEFIQGRINEIGDIDGLISKNEKEIKKLKLEMGEINLEDISKEKSKIYDEINELSNNISSIKNQYTDKIIERQKEIKTNYENTKNKIEQSKEKIKKNNSIIQTSCNDMVNLENNIKKYQKIVKIAKINEEIDWSRLKPYEEDIRHNQKIYDLLCSDYDKMVLISTEKECPVCFSSICPEKIKTKQKKKKETLKKQIKQTKEYIEQAQKEYEKEKKNLENGYNALISLEKADFMLAKQKASYDEAMRLNDVLNTEIKNFSVDIKKMKDEYTKNKKMMENYRNINVLQKQLKQKKLELQEIEDKYEEYNRLILEKNMEISRISGYIEELNRRNEEKRFINKQLNNINTNIRVYGNLKRAFGKDGIQAIIMENITEDLKNYTNQILKQICNDNIVVDFITQKQTGSGWREQFDINITLNNESCGFDGLSGGEQVRVSIALRLALSKLLMRRVGSDIRFLLLDEVDQALDKQGIDALSDAILALSKDLTILIITHNDNMKDKFDNIITVVKGSEGSTLIQ